MHNYLVIGFVVGSTGCAKFSN